MRAEQQSEQRCCSALIIPSSLALFLRSSFLPFAPALVLRSKVRLVASKEALTFDETAKPNGHSKGILRERVRTGIIRRTKTDIVLSRLEKIFKIVASIVTVIFAIHHF